MKAFVQAKTFRLFCGAFVIAAILSGCASGKVTGGQSNADSIILVKPGRIIVYDIAATAADVPPSSTMAGHYEQHSEPQSAEDIRKGRLLGAQVAGMLVEELLKVGIYAERASQGLPPRLGDVLVTGQFFAIDTGSQRRRLVIGFGRGANSLQTHIEAFLLTSQGHLLFVDQSIGSGGSKAPGLVVAGTMAVVTGNPVGLIVGSALAIRREMGSEKMSGAARRTAEVIADQVEALYKSRNWL